MAVISHRENPSGKVEERDREGLEQGNDVVEAKGAAGRGGTVKGDVARARRSERGQGSLSLARSPSRPFAMPREGRRYATNDNTIQGE